MARILPEPRQRLLDAGLKLFADGGYAGTSVQQITVEAKVTKPTLYYYFQSKGGLFQALVDQAMDERLRLIVEAAPADKPTVDQLTDIIVSVTSFARRQPDLLRLCFSIAFASPGEMPAGLRKSRKMGESYQFVRGIIAAGLKRGVLNRDFNVDELTQSHDFRPFIGTSAAPRTALAPAAGDGTAPGGGALPDRSVREDRGGETTHADGQGASRGRVRRAHLLDGARPEYGAEPADRSGRLDQRGSHRSSLGDDQCRPDGRVTNGTDN
jgi:AcrR family transcriptional regulator